MALADSEDKIIQRNRRTLYLLAGGAASLLIPLLGVLYIRMSDTSAAPAGNTPHAFARHDPADRLKAATTPAPSVRPAPSSLSAAPPAPGSQGAVERPTGDSLGFIKGSGEYFPTEAPQAAPAPAKTEAQPAQPGAETAQQEVGIPNPRKAADKPGTRAFVQPRLSDSKYSVRPFSITPAATGKGGQGMAKPGGAGQGAPPGGMPDMGGMLKNLPGAGGGGGTSPGMPDMSGMLQGLTGGAEKKK